MGECLDHLVRTGEAYLEVVDEAVEKAWGKKLIGDPPFRRTLVGRWVVRTLEPPPGLKIPAPRGIRPRRPEQVPGGDPGGGPSPAGAAADPGGVADPGEQSAPGEDDQSPLPRFMALRGRLAQRLGDAKGLDFGRVKVRSPFVPLLRVDLESAFLVVAAHERRHLWQARRVTEEEDFPEG